MRFFGLVRETKKILHGSLGINTRAVLIMVDEMSNSLGSLLKFRKAYMSKICGYTRQETSS